MFEGGLHVMLSQYLDHHNQIEYVLYYQPHNFQLLKDLVNVRLKTLYL